MPKAKAAPATQEDLDVERYRLTADLAVADAESLRERSARQQALLQQASQAAHVSKEESDELYEYLDAQMLSTARDRQASEAALQTFSSRARRLRRSRSKWSTRTAPRAEICCSASSSRRRTRSCASSTTRRAAGDERSSGRCGSRLSTSRRPARRGTTCRSTCGGSAGAQQADDGRVKRRRRTS